MPLKVEWYSDQKRGILLEFVQPYITTWDEYHKAIDCVCEMAQSVDHELALIVMLHDAKMPPGAPIQQIEKATLQLPDNILLKIAITPPNSFERNVITILLRVRSVKERLRVAGTWQEALAILDQAGLTSSSAKVSPG